MRSVPLTRFGDVIELAIGSVTYEAILRCLELGDQL